MKNFGFPEVRARQDRLGCGHKHKNGSFHSFVRYGRQIFRNFAMWLEQDDSRKLRFSHGFRGNRS